MPDYAIVDLKLPDGYGLKLISGLIALDRSIRIVVLTGYGSIPTAVEAIKLGATYYLAKPANVDEIVDAFHRDAGDDAVPVNGKTMSLSRLEWEYIQRTLQQHHGNVAASARALSMHRRHCSGRSPSTPSGIDAPRCTSAREGRRRSKACRRPGSRCSATERPPVAPPARPRRAVGIRLGQDLAGWRGFACPWGRGWIEVSHRPLAAVHAGRGSFRLGRPLIFRGTSSTLAISCDGSA